jgi:hypothetical protein
MRKSLMGAFLFLVLAVPSISSENSDKVKIFVVGLDDARPIAEALIEKLRASKPFEPVTQGDASQVKVLISCMHRDKVDMPFICMYVANFNGAVISSWFGGGLWFSSSADAVAENFLGAIAADIVERYNDTAKTNESNMLESCLLLTDSKCNVPERLQDEMGAKQMTMGQYLMKKH